MVHLMVEAVGQVGNLSKLTLFLLEIHGSMAVQLRGVIELMARANEGLQRLNGDSETVTDIATLWRESHRISKEIRKESEDGEQSRSSIHAFPRGLQ
jgi:Cu/Ag efflux pump CusA